MPAYFNKTHAICLGIIILNVVAASFGQTEWVSYGMHQVSTALGVALIAYFAYRAKASNLSVVLATGFILIHILGAKYLYSYVPYNEWILSLTGWDFNATFGFERNMYDRLVHFSYGLLLFPFFIEVFRVYFPNASFTKLAFLAILFNCTGSMIYELIEWGIAMTMSPEEAENYNGQQGDMWDAHKDMAIALLGGVMTWIALALGHKGKS